MAQLTRLGPGGYPVANRWPSGTSGLNVDLAGALATTPTLTGDVDIGSVDLAGALATTPTFTGDVSVVTAASAVDFAGAIGVTPTFAGAVSVTSSAPVDFAGAFGVLTTFTGDITQDSDHLTGSKYGLGPYGAGPYCAVGPLNEVTVGGSLPVRLVFAGDLDVKLKIVSGWTPVAPCPPSLWTPVPPCDESVDLELVE